VKLIGRVQELESGTPLAGATVMMMAATTRLEAQTGADGSFTLEGIPPGRGRLEVQAPGGFNAETHVGENTEIEARPGTPVIDVGTIKLIKGSYRDKFTQVTRRGMIGFSPAVLDGRPSVTAVRPGLPGEKAGLKHGELLLKIDGRSTEGMGNGALDFLAAGNVDQPLVLTVQPREGGTAREVTLHRAPLDYDPARPGGAPPPRSTTASRQPAPPAK
jgi:hypothetical protein